MRIIPTSSQFGSNVNKNMALRLLLVRRLQLLSNNSLKTVNNKWRFLSTSPGLNEQQDQKTRKERHWFPSAIGLCLALGFGAGYYANDTSKNHKNYGLVKSVVAANLAGGDPPRNNNRDRLNFIADVVETAAPSVVCIELIVSTPFGGSMKISNGSGFIVSADGLILTNAHLFSSSHAKIMVKLKDGRAFQGMVESIDPRSDLATVRISADNLPVLKLGSSTTLRPGEWVVAIGSPLSLSNTVTAGVVSTVGRTSSELGLMGQRNMEYIQTDAAITYGNSGGPLVNLDGEAIGINSMKVAPGISFAIPSDHAKEFLKLHSTDKLKGKDPKSTVSRASVGVQIVTLTPELIDVLKMHYPKMRDRNGILICEVYEGSPAAVAGIHRGDIITNINGKEVQSCKNLYEFLEKEKPIKCRVIRGDKEFFVTLTPEIKHF